MLDTIGDVLREAYSRGWITARDGNASVRNGNDNFFYITPSGVRKQQLQPDLFKKIGIKKEQSHGSGVVLTRHESEILPYTAVSSALSPSGELPLHFNIQKELGLDTNRVCLHLHPTYTIAAMLEGINLQDLCSEYPELSRYTKVAPTVPEVPPISIELGERCTEALGVTDDGAYQFDIVGIQKHGVVSIDTSPWRAFEHIERLEHICKIVLCAKR